MDEKNVKKTEPVVVLKNVTVAAPDDPQKPLINGVNWQVFPGDFWVIGGLGEAGKTAFLLTVVGIQKPAGGVVVLFNKDLYRLSESELVNLRLRTGFVFEGSGNLFMNLTVEENVILPLRYHYECDQQSAAEKASEVLKLVEIENYRNKLPNQIPKQYLKRVALARALVMSPEILFVDDPLKNLDVTQEQWWVGLLVSLSTKKDLPLKNPLTIIVATSDLRPWSSINHKVALICENEYKCLGDTELVYRNPDPNLKKLLLGAGEMGD